jgi:hypothetical protein
MTHRSWLKLESIYITPSSANPNHGGEEQGTEWQRETYHEQTGILWAEGILNGDLDIIKRDIRRSGGRTVARLDGLCVDAWTPLDEDDGEPAIGSAPHRKVIGKVAIGNPLLRPIDDPVFFNKLKIKIKN